MDELPFEELCFYAIVVKNGDLEKIANILGIVELEHLSWEDANKIRYRYVPEIDKKDYDYFCISHPILGWNYILFDNFIGRNDILQHCDKLSKIYDEIFAFRNDAHCGGYFFMKIKNRHIIRFFEDIDGERGEFGDCLEEEKYIDRSDGFLAVEVARNVLQLEQVKANPKLFERKVGVGKKYKAVREQNVLQSFFDFEGNEIPENFEHDLPF